MSCKPMLTFNQLKKNLRRDTPGLRPVKLAILADSASQLLTQAIAGYGVESGICFDIYEADYNQVDNEVFNRASGLYAFQPDFVLVNLSAERLLKRFYTSKRTTRAQFAQEQADYMSSLYQTISAAANSRVIINTFPEINDAVFGHYAAKEASSFLFQVRKLNLLLMELSQSTPGIYICDLLALQSELGYHQIFDPKMYINADMVYSIDFLPHAAKAVTDIILAVTGSFRKCVVVDLDNTMWGGIIGDDGMEGIQIGDLGLGKAFTGFQLWLKELKERGVIIAVCSKNTESIAREAFERHTDMVLRLDDIALFVANWENKVDNIRFIQETLNIGFDSMVFLDDNKFEREMVKTGITGITVPDLPEDPAEYLSYLRSLNLFETASFTHEDEQRTRLYQQESGRVLLKKSFASEGDFLNELEMKSDAGPFSRYMAPRVAQLSQRSNQFNLRTVRYTEQDILGMIDSADYYTLSVTLEDKFGGHGLIAAVIMKRAGAGALFIDTWIMSCRVLKRSVESFTLNCLVDMARKHGFRKITGEYIPTRKNGLVKDHYEQLGFTPLPGGGWELDLEGYIDRENFISRNKEPQYGGTTGNQPA